MIIHDTDKLQAMGRVYPWYVETRPQQVKQLGFDPESKWAVGLHEGRVRWLFQSLGDWQRFKTNARCIVLVAGYLGPLSTENRTWE